MKSIVKLVAIGLLAVAAAACSSSRNNGTPSAQRPGKVAPMRVSEVDALASTYAPWTSFYAPFGMRLSKPASFSFSGRATMEHGKAILLSMRILGMEVASVYADNDSVWVADKFHHYLVAVPFSSLSSRTGLNLTDLQSLLLGQAFYPGQGTIDSSKGASELFSPAHDGDKLILTPRRTPQGATWYLTADSSPALCKLTVEPDGMGEFAAVFSDIVSTAAGSVASEIRATGTIGKKQLDASIEWNLGKARWDDGTTCRKPDYKGYRRLSVAELLAALKSF